MKAIILPRFGPERLTVKLEHYELYGGPSLGYGKRVDYKLIKTNFFQTSLNLTFKLKCVIFLGCFSLSPKLFLSGFTILQSVSSHS